MASQFVPEAVVFLASVLTHIVFRPFQHKLVLHEVVIASQTFSL